MQNHIHKIGSLLVGLVLITGVSASAQQTRVVKRSYQFVTAQIAPGAAADQVILKTPAQAPVSSPKRYTRAQVDSLVKIGTLQRTEDGGLVGKRTLGTPVPKEEVDARLAVWDTYKRTWLRQPVPDVSFQNAQGEIFRLPELKGKVVVLSFGFSRCSPCLADRTLLEEVARRFQPNPEVPEVLFLMPMVEKNPRMPADSTSRLVVLPNAGQQARDVFQVNYWPTTFVVDRKGIIRNVVLGSHSDSVDKLTEYIRSIVLK
ncbi:TlpA family protein disulfide reductase [Rufibacter glacialis]|uniref:TlpA family protein disulfide reductase n=1 Tax=Rufibacter glacialis TaxID=1259555 RepID=A0A5M8QE08_9BACT|nr:TlpA disulfide reductase family protein [Rufibacter glacialis]KAA6433194.1 TlpA family protein disulfide reductase [Rufibacter glacialis]GGK76593.1 hypothetical protein GCM10011405_25480 [Rufibacter glacialis]